MTSLPTPSASTMRMVHLLLTLAWMLFLPFAVLLPTLRSSVPLLVAISVYANVAGHYSAYQAARAEENSPDK